MNERNYPRPLPFFAGLIPDNDHVVDFMSAFAAGGTLAVQPAVNIHFVIIFRYRHEHQRRLCRPAARPC